MSTPLLILIGSTITLVIMTGVFRAEDTRGGRYLVLGSLRHFFDRSVRAVDRRLHAWHPYLGQGFARLMMHYLVHTVLQRILRLLRWFEGGIERMLRRNRQVAKRIDSEKRRTHLDAIAEHKVATALTERQKQKRLSHD